jgi:hypothetical protein
LNSFRHAVSLTGRFCSDLSELKIALLGERAGTGCHHLLEGPIGIFCFNVAEGWSRNVSEDTPDELLWRCDLDGRELPEAVQDFFERYARNPQPIDAAAGDAGFIKRPERFAILTVMGSCRLPASLIGDGPSGFLQGLLGSFTVRLFLLLFCVRLEPCF